MDVEVILELWSRWEIGQRALDLFGINARASRWQDLRRPKVQI